MTVFQDSRPFDHSLLGNGICTAFGGIFYMCVRRKTMFLKTVNNATSRIPLGKFLAHSFFTSCAVLSNSPLLASSTSYCAKSCFQKSFGKQVLNHTQSRVSAAMADSQDISARDFSTESRISTSIQRPTHIDLEAQSPTHTHNTDASAMPMRSPPESVRQRRLNRSNTAKTYRPQRRGQSWQPGQEPGIDTSAPVDQYSSSTAPKFNENCQITTVDYSQTEMQQHELDNHSLAQFMAKPRPEWAVCRWINVNGLSWDVVKLLGNHYGLHRLAIEDLLNPRNRTKADWYTDHTFSTRYEFALLNLMLTMTSGSPTTKTHSSPLRLRL